MVDVGTVIAIVKEVYSLYQQFAKGSGLTLNTVGPLANTSRAVAQAVLPQLTA